MGARSTGAPGRSLRRRLIAAWSGLTSGLGEALAALWANKLRASLTTLGIVIGVMTVIGILSIIHGLDSAVERQMALMGVRSLYVSQRPWVMRGGWHRFRNRPPITPAQYRRLQELVPFADALSPVGGQPAKVERAGEQIEDVRLQGVGADYLRVAGVEVERGRFFSTTDVEFERPYTVIGSEVAGRLFPGIDPLGQTLDIRGSRFTVVGVLKSQGSFLGQSRDVTAIVPVGQFRRLIGQHSSLDIGLAVLPGMDLDEAADELTGLMRRVRGLRPTQGDDFAVNQNKQLGQMYNDITGTLFLVILIVSVISLAVGGIGIMNIMLVSVTERTREIGVRKALGARRRTILFQFLLESLVLSGLGGVLGLGLGFGVARMVDAISPLPAAVSAFAVAAGLGFSAFVGVAFGLYPAWRASRLDPIEALRYE